MSHKVNLIRMLTAATGNSTPITLGARYSDLFMTMAEAGAMDGRTYSYLIVDGNNWQIGRGVYTATGTTLARTTILASRISGTLGASRISLSGTAQVRIVEMAEDMDGVRGTRPVTGTSDTLNNSDQGYVVTYSNASAIAVSLAQASVSNLFLDGWAVFVKNKGAGAVTITPATSTIDGAATLVLAQNQGALIWSDGTNYQTFKFRGDLGTAAVRADTDFPRTDTAQSLTTTQQVQARANVYAAPFDAMAYNGMQVNGHHAISQENGDNAVSLPSGTFSKYVTDNWRVYKTGTSVLSVHRVASGIDGIPYALQADCLGTQAVIGADVALFGTWIEGSRFARASWGTANAVPISVGFWFKAGTAGTYGVVAYNFDGSASQTAPGIVISAANTWTWCTTTLPAKTSGTWKTDTSIGLDFQVVFAGSGSPNTLTGAPAVAAAITGLVVLPGIQLPTAAESPRILRPTEQEVIQCDRLWQTFGGAYSGNSYTFGTGTTAVSNIGVINIRLRGNGMRIAPGLSVSAASDFSLLDGGAYTPSSITLDSSDAYNAMLSLAISGAVMGRGLWLRSANANARMHFNARF